jgi:hypothetical protein
MASRCTGGTGNGGMDLGAAGMAGAGSKPISITPVTATPHEIASRRIVELLPCRLRWARLGREHCALFKLGRQAEVDAFRGGLVAAC